MNVFSCIVDMYFNFLYRYIIYVEFEKHGQIYSADLESVFTKYMKLSDYILDSTVKVKNPNIIVSDQEKSLFRSVYNQPLDQANAYKEMLSYYIVSRKNVTEQFRSETNELNFFVPLFAQITMLEGFKIATKRIKNMLNSKAYFGHEIITTKSKSVLKLFMSPYGALMKDQLVEKAKNNQLVSEIDEYLGKFNILRITDESRVKELKTKYVFHSQQDNQTFYFKRRNNEEREKEPSFEQDPTNPLRALIVQSQLNLIAQD